VTAPIAKADEWQFGMTMSTTRTVVFRVAYWPSPDFGIDASLGSVPEVFGLGLGALYRVDSDYPNAVARTGISIAGSTMPGLESGVWKWLEVGVGRDFFSRTRPWLGIGGIAVRLRRDDAEARNDAETVKEFAWLPYLEFGLPSFSAHDIEKP